MTEQPVSETESVTALSGEGARASQLRRVVAKRAYGSFAAGGSEMILAAIVEELGITPEMVDEIRSAAWLRDKHFTDGSMLREHADALSTLLHAAGTRRTPA